MGVCDREVARQAAAAGVRVTAVSPYYLRVHSRSGILLGFAAFDERQIDAAMIRLAPIVARMARTGTAREAS